MAIHRSLPVLALMALMSASPAAAQPATGAAIDETARVLVARFAARTILQDAELDLSQVPALIAEWPTDLKLALALDPSNEKQRERQVEAVKAHLVALTARLKNDLYVESWLRNRIAELKDVSRLRSAEMLESRSNDAAAPRARDAVRARIRLKASLGDSLSAFEQTFRTAVRNMLVKSPALVPALAVPAPESTAILESRNRLMAALTEAEKRLNP